jgi:DNA-binding IclR family transcriptional regulator
LIIDPKKFFKEAEEVKKKGYAIDNEEYILGVKSIAALLQTNSLLTAAI